MKNIKRRDFLKISAAGTAAMAAVPKIAWSKPENSLFQSSAKLISPGCRGTKVKVAKIYMGRPQPHWPKPSLDLKQEVKFYESWFNRLKQDFSDVDFVVSTLAGSPEDVKSIGDKLKDVDGILAIHLTIWIQPVLEALVALKKPTVIFAAPYSGHEWVNFGALLKDQRGDMTDAILTTNYQDLALAVKPFRAAHHLREAKILNLTTAQFDEYAEKVRAKFGTEIKRISLDRVQKTYQTIQDKQAREESEKWLRNAERLVEPSTEEVFRSAKLALAFDRLLDEESATVLAIDCYGSMWDKTIKLPAYPCLGFSRLNSLGFGGICESDLRSAMTHIIFQGLSGKPGFISDPTVDEGQNVIILAHCMGTVKMDGPEGPEHRYKLRSVMEREEGVVPQVQMRVGEKVTQAILVGLDKMLYFTGEIAGAPVSLEDDRGCRTKIAVRVDGDLSKLWRNWSAGLHRVTCYGNIQRELRLFAKFNKIELINEAV